jgi:ATP-dependent DNA helicase RecG
MALVRTRRGFSLVKAILEDDTGAIEAVWFNQPFVAKQVKIGMALLIKGKVQGDAFQKQINVAYYERDEERKIQGLQPVYPLTEGINGKQYRQWVRTVLEDYLAEYPELLPLALREEHRLLAIRQAWQWIHFPPSPEEYGRARQRLALEELLLFRLLSASEERLQPVSKIRSPYGRDLIRPLTEQLPYSLTPAQQRVLQEIRGDLQQGAPMSRLLQGDVGSGKTIVAFLSMLDAVERGHQAALMAPTEILVRQHFNNLCPLAEQLQLQIALLTSATGNKERLTILEALADGSLNLIVGTHALLQPDITFHSLDMIVIDEQHRFGVKQRAFLQDKGLAPDILVMTATPIPRTLALVIYGQLRISVIDELPPGRQEIKSKVVPLEQREQAYAFVAREVRQKGQAYVVCPLIEESEKQDLTNAVELYGQLQQWFEPDISVGLVHGRMKSEEKKEVMEQFQAGKLEVLVSTTVIEVGVDVPTANVMVVEHADRFGLSQLHQLRGRVGRGRRQSYCVLLGDLKNETAARRLQALEKTNDGFELAGMDLTLRGPGDMWGFKQHGLDELKIIRLEEDQAEIAAWSDWLETLPGQVNQAVVQDYLALKFKEHDKIILNSPSFLAA